MQKTWKTEEVEDIRLRTNTFADVSCREITTKVKLSAVTIWKRLDWSQKRLEELSKDEKTLRKYRRYAKKHNVVKVFIYKR